MLINQRACLKTTGRHILLLQASAGWHGRDGRERVGTSVFRHFVPILAHPTGHRILINQFIQRKRLAILLAA